LSNTVSDYLRSQGKSTKNVNALCQKLAVETCLHNPLALPVLAAKKFLLSTQGPVSIGFTARSLYEKQLVGFTRHPWVLGLSKRLTGQALADKTQVADFLRAHYQPMGWYSFLDQQWRRLTMSWRPRAPKSAGQNIPKLP